MQHHRTATKTIRKRSTTPKAAKQTSGLRADTPQNLTGEAKQMWLTEEINYINELIPFLQGTFKESERGQIDRHQLMSTLILTEILLNRYACNLLAMQEREDRWRAVQETQLNGKIYLLADIRRAKAGEQCCAIRKPTTP